MRERNGSTPTLIEYGVGSGRVLAVAQTVEFAWMEGQDAALILENSVPYALAFDPFVDVSWLSSDPIAGVVAEDESQAITVTVDSVGLEPGTYTAIIGVRTNDPLNRIIQVPVTMTVAA